MRVKALHALCVVTVVVAGIVSFLAILAATYTHEGSPTLSAAGIAAQLALAVIALAASILAYRSSQRRVLKRAAILAVISLVAAAGWLPLVAALWD